MPSVQWLGVVIQVVVAVLGAAACFYLVKAATQVNSMRLDAQEKILEEHEQALKKMQDRYYKMRFAIHHANDTLQIIHPAFKPYDIKPDL